MDNDIRLLRECIALAAETRQAGAHPFGALLTSGSGEVIARFGNNSPRPAGDPTQHAELRTVAHAARLLSPEELAESTLYSSAEPCVMCSGAIYWTGVGRVVYALSEVRLKELTGDDPENPTFSFPCREVFARGQRTIEVVGPLIEDEAAVPHEGFWA
ncbi:nucleoside deaminase [Gryllotalpicola koreensis]|uniref:Nucleoside deaminase n=1 Tax=Gryllotalpicola koreensis TaxID=993086 RepID=A0ABP7ZP82_9MICO